MTLWLLVAAGATAALAKGVVGFGFPPIAIPIATAIVGAQTAVVVLAIPSLFLNLLQAWTSRATIVTERWIIPLVISISAGSFVGGYLLTILSGRLTMTLIGVGVIASATLAMLKLDGFLSPDHSVWIKVVIGLVAGLLAGATGFQGPVLLGYLSMLRLDKNRFVALVSILFLVAQFPQVVAYVVFGLFTNERLIWAGAILPGVAIGFYVGCAIRSRISEQKFAFVVKCALFIIGFSLLVEAARG